MSKSISFNLGELQEILNATLKGDPSCVVDNIATISNSNDSSISFVTELPKGLGLHEMVDFELQFNFAVPLLRHLIAPLMNRAVSKFVDAFEARAHEVYGAQKD
mgnify:CR=1 FL=1